MGLAKFDFSEKVALVTGAASGIGREIALEYSANGAYVVVSDVDEDGGRDVAREISDANGTAKFIPCDVSDAHQVKTLVKKTISEYGTINVACNDAGIEGESPRR